MLYYTIFNGSRPYKVRITGKNVEISSLVKYKDDYIYGLPVLTFKGVKKIFIGKDKSNKKLNGNSILINTSGMTYVYIGHSVYQFKSSKEIKSYHSLMGNNEVPYPFAKSADYTYFLMFEKKLLSKYLNYVQDDNYTDYIIDNMELSKNFKVKYLHKVKY